jgi:hypothetical protein
MKKNLEVPKASSSTWATGRAPLLWKKSNGRGSSRLIMSSKFTVATLRRQSRPKHTRSICICCANCLVWKFRAALLNDELCDLLRNASTDPAQRCDRARKRDQAAGVIVPRQTGRCNGPRCCIVSLSGKRLYA